MYAWAVVACASVMASASSTADPAAGSSVERVVGVLGLSGSAPAEFRQKASEALRRSLLGLGGVAVVRLDEVGIVLGAEAKRRMDACADDACVVKEARAIRTDELVLGRVDDESGRRLLRLRRVESSSAAVVAKVSFEAPGQEDALEPSMSDAVMELFPELAGKAFGTVVVMGLEPGTEVSLDGAVAVRIPEASLVEESSSTLRMKPGLHRIDVKRAGREPFHAELDVRVGSRIEVEAVLARPSQIEPWIVGGVGLAVIATGVGLGAAARGIREDWRGACNSGMGCEPGFTRSRYGQDEGRVATLSVLGQLAIVAGSACVLTAAYWLLSDPAPTGGEAP